MIEAAWGGWLDQPDKVRGVSHDNAMTGEWRVGVDIGGTFTDVVAYHTGTKEMRTAKVCSGAGDPVAGLLTAAFAAIGMTWDEIAELVHGTTIVTNAIVEERLSDVALVATEGFADTLAIGRQNRRHLYRLDLPPKAPPQVPEERRLEVPERLNANGTVIEDLTDEAIEEVVQQVAASGVEAVAVSLLHAYANPAHEERLGERLREAVPHVALSHRVNPEAREYERTATTVLSAAVMPLATRYLGRLESEKPKNSRLHLFHSAGGMASPEALGELPLGLVMSGPAAGVVAASRVARDLGIDNAISFDMGGTTTDVCLITDGQAHIRADRSLGARPLRQPMVAVETIGAGGGSIARLDTGALRVGPDSAGASPGPACYGRGGSAPTVSDANMVLGCLESGRTLGDGIVLDGQAARRALAPLAAEIGTDEVEVAFGIVRVANAAMARALGKVTVERGIDGRGCTLLAFGGAGPMHAVEVARTFGIRRVVVPRFSGGFSALGCISAELSYSQQQTVRMASGAWDRERLNRIRNALFSQLSAPLAAAGHGADELVVESVAAIRYRGQSYAVEVPSPDLDDPDRLGRGFRRLHDALYGFETNEPWELVGLRLRVSVPREAGVDGVATMGAEPAEPGTSSLCSFGPEGPVRTFRYAREALAEGQRIEGPAIVEDDWSTVVVPPRATLWPDAAGHLIVDVETAA